MKLLEGSSRSRPLFTEALAGLVRTAIVNVRFWYFTDIDALGQNAIGAMDPSRVPNALVGHYWTFLLTVVLTVVALPYASQKHPSGLSILKPVDITFLLLSLFLSTVTLAVRQAYIWKTRSLERYHARLLRRYKQLERRFNVWPLPATRQVSALLQNFESHKLAVIESGSFMLLASLIVTAIHAGLITQSILRLTINYQIVRLRTPTITMLPYNLIALVNGVTLLDYVLRIPIITRFQWLYCLTHFPPIQPPAEGG